MKRKVVKLGNNILYLTVTMLLAFLGLLVVFWIITHTFFIPMQSNKVTFLKCQRDNLYMNIGLNFVDFLLRPTSIKEVWVPRTDIQNVKVKCRNLEMPFLNVQAICVWWQTNDSFCTKYNRLDILVNNDTIKYSKIVHDDNH